MKTPDLPVPFRAETSDGPAGLIALVGILLLAGVGLILLGTAWSYRSARAGRPGTGLSFTSGPLEETGVARDWREQDALVHRHLETYGWIDRRAGRVRIPIEQAMTVLAAEATGAAPREASP